jgi:ABC-type uncharacterized transport system auxiliary subunit
MSPIRNRLPVLTLLAAALMLGACVSLPEGQPPPQRYVLAPLAATAERPAPARIAVAPPRLPAGLASERIAVLRPGGRLDHVAGAQWAAALPDLVHDFLVGSVENRLGAAAWGAEPARYRLVTALQDFQAEYGSDAQAPPRVRVTLVAELWDAERGRLVLRQRRSASRELAANRVAAITSALQGLLREVAGDVLDSAGRRLAEGLPRDRSGGGVVED